MSELVFYLLAIFTLIPAIFVVTSRNIFHAGLWLLPTLLGVAGFFLTLANEFLAAAQVLIYVGGIMVLLLFAILLTRRISDPEVSVHNRFEGWALLFAGAIVALLISLTWRELGGKTALMHVPVGTTEQMGTALLGRYLLPFELVSVILLAAIIGAIVIARGERRS